MGLGYLGYSTLRRAAFRTGDRTQAAPPGIVRLREECVGKLLVVDDDELMLGCVAAILAAAGYDLVTAQGGAQAVQLCQAMGSDIAAVIMDVMMPGMSGIMAAKQIRANDRRARIILMSGVSAHGQALEDADAFIAKPFRSAELLALVRKTLGD